MDRKQEESVNASKNNEAYNNGSQSGNFKPFYTAPKSSLFPKAFYFRELNKPFSDLFDYYVESTASLKLSSPAGRVSLVGAKDIDGSIVLGTSIHKDIAHARGKTEVHGSADTNGDFSVTIVSHDRFTEGLKVRAKLESALNSVPSQTRSRRQKQSSPFAFSINSEYYASTYGLGIALNYVIKYTNSLNGSVGLNVGYVPSASAAAIAARTSNSNPAPNSGTWAFGATAEMGLGSSVSVRSKELRKLQAVASYRTPLNITNVFIASDTGDELRMGIKYQQDVTWWNCGKFGVTIENIKKFGANSLRISAAALYKFDQPNFINNNANANNQNSNRLSGSQIRAVINSSGTLWCGYTTNLGDHSFIKVGAKFNLANPQASNSNQFGFSVTVKGS